MNMLKKTMVEGQQDQLGPKDPSQQQTDVIKVEQDKCSSDNKRLEISKIN